MKRKIAILGAGISALTTAFDITDLPNWQDAYEVTVYQLGWRIGGKGASSRNPEISDRIEEHGLHIWLGFYENAFSVIRSCYKELNRRPDSPLCKWDDAFKPHTFVVLEENINAKWSHWPVTFPVNASQPGDGNPLPTIWDYVLMAIQWVEQALGSMGNPTVAQTHSIVDQPKPPWWDATMTKVLKDASEGDASVGSALIRVASDRANSLDRAPAKHPAQDHQVVHWFLQQLTNWMHSFVKDLSDNTELRRIWIPIDLFTAALRGILADGLIYHGFDPIDSYDYRDWLRKHGASNLALQSAWLRGGYDLAFSFVGGNTNEPNTAAGAGLRSMLRMTFAYKGAPIWKMQAGMGESVFTPLYQVLKARGVRFKFFHKVMNLKLSDDKTHVAEIQIARQATVNADQDEYDPLVVVRDLPCWPPCPRYEQLQEGGKLRNGRYNLESFWTDWTDVDTISLKEGQDFDVVVLGIPVGALTHICGELITANRRWQTMVNKVQTIQTQGFQVWLKPSLAEAGWDFNSPILGAYVEPIDTWADMTQLLKMETWPPENFPRQLAYFCGVMVDAPEIPGPEAHDFPAQEYQKTRETALDYLRNRITYLLPQTLDPVTGSFNWNLLIAPEGSEGPDRFNSQYWRPNIDPSERYVLAVAGTTEYRLRTDESGFTNLILTGDWIRNGLNTAGCIESAVISGRQAARNIIGGEYTIVGETDFA
jgi:uncharacterized protein with NAD-binding domain and iron-sulfur cluster